MATRDEIEAETMKPFSGDAPLSKDLDPTIRQRIAGHLRYFRWQIGSPPVAKLATQLGMSRSALGRYLKGEDDVGLDTLIRFRLRFGLSIDQMISTPIPDKRFLSPSFEPEPLPKPPKS